jgi:hypothetical protein
LLLVFLPQYGRRLIATRRPASGAFGTGSLAENANTQTAKFCTSRRTSTLTTTQKLILATVSFHPPNPTTPGPGTCAGSSSQPTKARPVKALSATSKVSMRRRPGDATRWNLTPGSAEKSSGPAISARAA